MNRGYPYKERWQRNTNDMLQRCPNCGRKMQEKDIINEQMFNVWGCKKCFKNKLSLIKLKQ